MVSYLGLRLAIDFIKPGLAFAGLTSIQWVCLLTLVHYRRDIARWNFHSIRLVPRSTNE